MAAHSTFTDVLAAHWSDDFAPLQDAGKAVLTALREDENAPDADLYRRIGAFGNGSHQYFAATGSSLQSSTEGAMPTTPIGMSSQPSPMPALNPPPTITVSHDQSIPLPPFMSQQLLQVKSASLMGLMPQAELAWLTVDDKLFIWPYSAQQARDGPSFCSFTVPNGQCVLSVGLVHPKKGVFRPSVKWCLVVTTPEEVMLCALANANGLQDNGNDDSPLAPSTGSFRLVPTRFSLPTDNVRMLCVCGTPAGRIFLGGEDGCLYEMTYENPDPMAPSNRPAAASLSVDTQLEQFYEHGKPTPGTIREGGVGGWAASGKRLLLGPTSMEHRPRKCRKLNHSSHVSSLASAVVPDFLVKATSFILGAGKSSTGGGSIVKMVVDEERSCLYTLGSKGWICAFSMLDRGQDGNARLAAVMNAPETARLYLDAVARQRMTPPHSHSPKIGNITFAGGGSAAQKGVGGMDGARNILSLAKLNGNAQSVLTPISMHVVPRRESGRITLMAVTKGGLRYYISSLSPNSLASGVVRSSERKESLAPSGGRLSLYHIRAPPPLEESTRTQDISTSMDADDSYPVGGFVPKLASAVNKMPEVDASFYGGSTMVLAVEQPKEQSATKQGDTVGDHIVFTTPDFVRRKSMKVQTATESFAPGGVSETLSLPLSDTSSTDSAQLLPGGFVSDIAQASADESSVLKLAMNSRTPTDTELSVGLVPEFIPEQSTSKRNNGAMRTNGHGAGNSSGMVIAGSTSLASTAMAVAWNIIPNLLLSRPLYYGVRFQQPAYQAAQRSRVMPPSYHTSRRYGTQGFSLTAADIASNKKQDTVARKAPRLNPWLLQPAAAPLNPLTLQHLLPSTQVVVMNSGGLHYFKFSSILSAFEETITAAGENVEHDDRVTSFFTSYGYAEGCAMCIMLALGLGSGGVNSSLATFAGRAVNTRAYSPKLKPAMAVGTGLVADAVPGADPLLPNGYVFQSSALLDGVVKVTARLLRPVWYKPLVVATEGRTVALKWKSERRVTPSKVELLLDDATLAQILHSLNSLAELMKVWFEQAIETVPGKLRTQSHLMDIEERGGQNLAITDAFARQSYLRDSSGIGNGLLAPSEAERLAKLTEERKIHSMFRLVTRSRQLLQLFALLLRAHRAAGLPEVQWGSLHGLTVSQLVQTRDGQERLEKMLNNLVTSTADLNQGISEPSAEADQLATEFADRCYLYFSPGSRYAYLGFSLGRRALACNEGSARRMELTAMAKTHFIKAAKHWHSASLVTGRSLHIREHEGFEEVARAAYTGGSPVAKAATMLAELSDVVAIVDVCLTTAKNFGMAPLRAAPGDDQLHLKALPWENELYHKRQEFQEASKSLSGTGPSTPASPSSRALTLGTSVSAENAMTACWFLIFYHLTVLLQRPESRSLAVKMVSRCSAEPAGPFLNAFYSHLKESGNTETLLQIRSPSTEQWLDHHVKDRELLYKYYCIQGEDTKAGNLSLSVAKDDRIMLALNDRMKWLSNAIGACSGAKQQANFINTSIATEARDLLDIAKLQLRVLEATKQVDLSAPQRQELSAGLMPVTKVFELAYGQGLNEICLLLMHTCKENNVTYIETLWRNIICEAILPCFTRDPNLHAFLESYVGESDFASEKNLVSLLETASSADEGRALFEEGGWKKTLEMKVASLGRDLYGKGADYVFPIDFLFSEFEKLRAAFLSAVPAQEDSMSQAWSLRIFTNVGVRYIYMEMLHAWESRAARDEQFVLMGGGSGHRLDQLAGVVSLLRDWVEDAVAKKESRQELLQAYHSARLSEKIRSWKHELEQMKAASLFELLGSVELEIEGQLAERGAGMLLM